MYEGFVVPGQMVFEVYYNRVKQYDLTPSYNPSNRQLTATFTAEQVKAFPLIADVRIRFDGSYPFRLQIKPTTEGTDNGVVGYTIQQAGDSYTVIEIYAKDEIDAQVVVAIDQAQIATTKASEAAGSASTAATAATNATNQATTATTKASEATTARNQAVTAQTAAEAARDIAIENSMEVISVASYAAAVPYFTGSRPRKVFVANDEAYYDNAASHYDYFPGKGEALLGVDYNYKD